MLATCVPCKRTSDVEVAAPATAKFDPENRNCEVEVVKVKAKLDVAPPPSWPKSICESTPDDKLKAVEVEYLLPWKS